MYVGNGRTERMRQANGWRELKTRKVSKDDRGRLQSHGITGVQARHYDGHEYTDEKCAALDQLLKFLEPADPGNVIPIRSAA